MVVVANMMVGLVMTLLMDMGKATVEGMAMTMVVLQGDTEDTEEYPMSTNQMIQDPNLPTQI